MMLKNRNTIVENIYNGSMMQRAELEQHIAETYRVESDNPWKKYPNHQVFRHCDNRKWFALVMDVPKNKLGISEDGVIDVVNVKCDPLLIGSLLAEPGFFPAYHMSKSNWITIVLDDSVDDEKIKILLDMSFDLTRGR